MGGRSIGALVSVFAQQAWAVLLCESRWSLDDSEWDIKDNKYRVFLQGEWIVVPDDAVLSDPNKFGKAIVWLHDYADIVSGDVHTITRIQCFIPGSGV